MLEDPRGLSHGGKDYECNSLLVVNGLIRGIKLVVLRVVIQGLIITAFEPFWLQILA